MISTSGDIHLRALDRQTRWEFDFAYAGDLESALDACLDAHALAAELGITEDESGRRSSSRWR